MGMYCVSGRCFLYFPISLILNADISFLVYEYLVYGNSMTFFLFHSSFAFSMYWHLDFYFMAPCILFRAFICITNNHGAQKIASKMVYGMFFVFVCFGSALEYLLM